MKKLIPLIVLLGAIFCLGSFYLKSMGTDEPAPSSSYTQLVVSSQSKEENSSSRAVSSEYVDYYFRNSSLKKQHYEKHGVEMGFSSRNEYEKAASRVINNPSALSKTEKEDGDYVFYIEETNEFVILSTDGYIRTYFLPSAGKAYYDRQ